MTRTPIKEIRVMRYDYQTGKTFCCDYYKGADGKWYNTEWETRTPFSVSASRFI